MNKVTVTVRLDTNILKKIDSYAKFRHMNRSKAMISLLENTNVIVIQEGTEIIKLLTEIQILLKHLQEDDAKKIERVCNDIWQLLNLTTEKIQRQYPKETS